MKQSLNAPVDGDSGPNPKDHDASAITDALIYLFHHPSPVLGPQPSTDIDMLLAVISQVGSSRLPLFYQLLVDIALLQGLTIVKGRSRQGAEKRLFTAISESLM